MRGITIAVAVLLFGVQTQAGTITEIASFDMIGDAIFGFYPLYNPAANGGAPLNGVAFSVTAYGAGDPFELVNTSSTNTITFNAQLSGGMTVGDLIPFYPGGAFYFSQVTAPFTLGPGQSTFVFPVDVPGPPGALGFGVLTTNLSEYIGTGRVGTLFSFSQEQVLVTNSNMIMVIPPNSNSEFPSPVVTETVTYYYGNTLPPSAEPASVVMMSLGLAAVAGMAWRRRLAA